MIVLAPKKGEKLCFCFSPRRLRKFPNSFRWIKKWAFPYVERLVFWFYSRLKLEQYTTTAKTFLEINLTSLIYVFISYFNLLYFIIFKE